MRLHAILASAALLTATAAPAFEPGDGMKCLAPSSPGGGWDFTCRAFGKALEDFELTPGPVQVLNMPGAAGAVGFAHVLANETGNENYIVAASTNTAAQFAQEKYAAGPEAIDWVGTLGADFGVLAVGPDSPFEDLGDLVEAMKADPSGVKFTGGSGVGGWDHLKLLITARAAGVENLPAIPWLSSSNSGEALTQVAGGHVDVFSGDLSEVAGFFDSGDVRVLAVLAPERIGGRFDVIPTAVEQGVDAIGPNWRGFYMPGGASDEAQAYWSAALDTIATSDEWAAVMAENGLNPFHKSGDEMDAFVAEQIDTVKALATEIGLIQ